MSKILFSLLAATVALLLGAVLMPSLAFSSQQAATQKSFGLKATCATNASGYCTINHNLGVVPDVVQAQPINYNAIVTTRNWNSVSVQLRLAKRINTNNSVDPWPNISVQVSLLGLYTPAIITSPPPTTAPSPSITATPSTTVSPSASTTPQPTATTTPPVIVGQYPTANTTGVPAGTSLTVHSGDLVITEADTVVDAKKITGDVDIRAAGVVIKNSEVNGRVINDNIATHHAFVLEDSTVGPATSCSTWGNGAIGIENYTAKRVHVRGFTDGFRVAGGNITIQDSYVKLCGTDPEMHSDGIQAYGAANGQNIVIKHNTIDQRSVISEAQTAPIFIPNDGERQGNQNLSVAVDDNLLAGGGFSLRVYGDLPFTATSVTGNKIVDGSFGYGPVDVSCDKILAWSGNAVVTYDWETGNIISEVRSLDSVCP